MKEKVLRLLKRLKEIEDLLSDPEIHSNPKKFRQLSQEHSYLTELQNAWTVYERLEKDVENNRLLLSQEKDPEILKMAEAETESLKDQYSKAKISLETLLIPPDPRDHLNTILEIRAGTGGEEAALFVADCVRMYQLYAAEKGWKTEVLSATSSAMGGYKEYILGLSGKNVFRLLQYEAGTHRVQRVPETETQGRVHTSAITIAVLPEPPEEEILKIDEKDLRIETYRASGAGGQHVNTTDSAVRITHIPTNTVVCCQDERSQHKNKEKAMRIISAKIAENIRKKQHEEQSALRSSQVGSGDRSERIRTYNFSQNRVTDHRIQLTLYQLDQIMEGHLDLLVQPLVAYFYQQKLSQ